MKIAIVLVHNKGDQENFNQIETIKQMVIKIDDGNDSYHYEVDGLNVSHELKLYQILPYGVTQPTNFYELDSHNVLYRNGDEDKTGDHPRFFNWGTKRATDYGADVVIHIDNATTFTLAKLKLQLLRLVNDTEFLEPAWGKIATLRLFKEAGQIDEDRPILQALQTFKIKLQERGLKNG